MVGGRLGLNPPSSCLQTDAHFWVKIGLKLQSRGKISNISVADLPVLFGQFQHCKSPTTLLDIHRLIFGIAPFFIPSTPFCSLSSWFTPFCSYHLITVITFALTITHSIPRSFTPDLKLISFTNPITGHWRICFYRAMLRRARYCYGKLSVCPSVRNVEVLWLHRLEIFKNNFMVS